MAVVDPVALFKEHPEELGEFLRALGTLHRTGVLEALREGGQVQPTSENSPNYLAAQAARANFSLGWNRALDTLIHFKEMFLSETNANTAPPLEFGSLERAFEAGDLTQEEINAVRSGNPIPTLKREPIPPNVYLVRPSDGGSDSANSSRGGRKAPTGKQPA